MVADVCGGRSDTLGRSFANRTRELRETSLEFRGGVNGGLGFRHVPLRLCLVFSHYRSYSASRTKIVDGAHCLKHELPDRLCNWIANIAVRVYSSEPVLHLHVRVQHPIMDQE
jgi:hypothetical protein